MGLMVIVIWLVIIFIVTGILQWLWNITCPQVFRLPEITFWQAFRLILISGILFGGFHYVNSTGGAVSHTIHFNL